MDSMKGNSRTDLILARNARRIAKTSAGHGYATVLPQCKSKATVDCKFHAALK